jgi:tetrahydromethanopterin S-methyltransferase subunit B|tara:strand:- start:698 stop:913 length:216 start_codon:yes stop_codon:yes gene_type:complete
VDKINEVMLAITSGLVAIGVWIFKRLFKSIDIAHERIDKLEDAVDRKYLETQLAPIRQDLNIITQHLLDRK